MTGGPTRLLLAAPPFSGHLNPLIAMARRLREHGYDPRFVTGPARVAVLRDLGFAAEPVLASDPTAFERIADTAGPVGGSPVRLARQLAANLALMPAVISEFTAIVDRVRPALIMADFTAPIAGQVARAAGLGWITVIPSPFVIETRTGTPAYCGGWGPPRHLGHEVRNAAGRLITRGVKHSFGLIFARQFRRLPMTIYRQDGSESAYSDQAILGLGMRELEFSRDWPASFELIGPITETPEGFPALPVLPRGKVVLVTVGTHLQWAKRDLVERLRPLAAAFGDRQFVVALGRPPATPGQAVLAPCHAERNITVWPYLPYDELMPAFEAVIHHGGAGITYSAIRHAIPSLVWPRDYDQFDFAARIETAAAGLQVRRLDSPKAFATFDRVLAMDRAPLTALAAAAARYDPYAATIAAVARRIGVSARSASP